MKIKTYEEHEQAAWDQFAAAALAGLLSDPNNVNTLDVITACAAKYADSMIEQRRARR